MKDQSFTTSFRVDKGQDEVFDAIKNVRGWWSEGIEGRSEKVGDEFTYRHEDVHRSKQKLTELVPGKRVVWQVVSARLSFTRDEAEWIGTRLVFDLTRKGKKTEVRFTHQGLVPDRECYPACSSGWGYYVGESLRSLITTGTGLPDLKPSAAGRRAAS